jgi:ribosomal protein L14
MVQAGTMLRVTDKTAVVLVECLRVFGPMSKRIAYIGDVVLVSIKKINIKKLMRLRVKKRRRYTKGSLSRALVIRAKVNFCRIPGVFVKFDENTVVLVNKRKVPVSNRVFGPVLRELCMRLPSLGCVTRYII